MSPGAKLPGCLTEGWTQAEALKIIQDAIRVYLEDVEAEARHRKAKLVQDIPALGYVTPSEFL